MSHIGGANTNSTTSNDNILNEARSTVVDDITDRLESMNVDITNVAHSSQTNSNRDNSLVVQQTSTFTNQPPYNNNSNQQLVQQTTNATQLDYCSDQHFMDADNVVENNLVTQQGTIDQRQAMAEIAYKNFDRVDYSTPSEQSFRREPPSNLSTTLTVTNLDPSIFNDESIRSDFEALFRQYDQNITFRYLKSFKRVRLDFSSAHRAELARQNLHNYRLGCSQIKCYHVQIIRPNSIGFRGRNNDSLEDANDDSEKGLDSNYLRLPKLTKQFLISPPASPPVDWEPVTESSPCIDVQLISAIANLVPGTAHEIHPGSESQPCIVVEVCEEPNFEKKTKTIARTACPKTIPRTMSPLLTRQQS